MKYIIITFALALSPKAGAGSTVRKTFTLRCTQGTNYYAVRFTALSKDQTEFMRKAMLRQRTISNIDLCVTTSNN
jgi:hypothetical protein